MPTNTNTVPAETFKNYGAAALVSKLNKSPERSKFKTNNELEGFVPNLSSLSSISESRTSVIHDNAVVLQVLPFLETASQLLVASIISPKDSTTVNITPTLSGTDLPSSVIASTTEVINDYLDNDYDFGKKLGTIVRSAVITSGSYGISVIPENSIDHLINTGGAITMESLEPLFDPNMEVKDIGFFNNSNEPLAFALESLGVKYTPNNHRATRTEETLKINVEVSVKDPTTKTLKVHKQDNLDTLISISDNFNLLKLNKVTELAEQNKVKSILGIATESKSVMYSDPLNREDDFEDLELMESFFKEITEETPIAEVKPSATLDRVSIGKGVIHHWPAESLIPIHVPGSPDKHLGYLGLIDEMGHVLSNRIKTSEFDAMSAHTASNLLSNAANGSTGNTIQASTSYNSQHSTLSAFNSQFFGGDHDTNKELYQTYSNLIDKQLLNSLRDLLNGRNIEIGNKEDVYSMLMSRSLAARKTRILYLPADMVTYFAFAYNEDGTGKSLLEDNRINNSLLVCLTIADAYANLRNTIGNTKVDIELDESDPAPQQTIAKIYSEFIQNRTGSAFAFPMGTSNISALTEWMSKAGIYSKITGHPGLPQMSVDITNENYNFPGVDKDTLDKFTDNAILGLGIPPELVRNSLEVEFATIAVANQLRLAKTSYEFQRILNPLITKHLKMVMRYDSKLCNDIKLAIKDKIKDTLKEYAGSNKTDKYAKVVSRCNTDEGFLQRIIDLQFNTVMDSLYFELPTPITKARDIAIEEFKKEASDLEEIINKILDSGLFLTKLTNPMDNNNEIDLKPVILAYFLRRKLIEGNVCPELLEFLQSTTDPDDPFYKDLLNFWSTDALSRENVQREIDDIALKIAKISELRKDKGDEEEDSGY